MHPEAGSLQHVEFKLRGENVGAKWAFDGRNNIHTRSMFLPQHDEGLPVSPSLSHLLTHFTFQILLKLYRYTMTPGRMCQPGGKLPSSTSGDGVCVYEFYS